MQTCSLPWVAAHSQLHGKHGAIGHPICDVLMGYYQIADRETEVEGQIDLLSL